LFDVKHNTSDSTSDLSAIFITVPLNTNYTIQPHITDSVITRSHRSLSAPGRIVNLPNKVCVNALPCKNLITTILLLQIFSIAFVPK